MSINWQNLKVTSFGPMPFTEGLISLNSLKSMVFKKNVLKLFFPITTQKQRVSLISLLVRFFHQKPSSTLPCLYAGKMHALLFRGWKQRVKGRDWYDFEWYTRHRVGLDLNHFQQRMQQSHPELSAPDTLDDLKQLVKARIDQLNIEDAKSDVTPFIKNTSEPDFTLIGFDP